MDFFLPSSSQLRVSCICRTVFSVRDSSFWLSTVRISTGADAPGLSVATVSPSLAKSMYLRTKAETLRLFSGTEPVLRTLMKPAGFVA